MAEISEAVAGILAHIEPGTYLRIHRHTMEEASLGQFAAVRATALAHGLAVERQRSTGDYLIRDPKYANKSDLI